MPDNAERQSRMWAVLIGIDDYKGSDDLDGCVRDVTMVHEYLELNPLVEKTLFVARRTADQASPTAQLPTYDNITEHLSKVTGDAVAGDHVLLFFSGHGARTRERLAVADIEGNMALVVRLPHAPWKKYLRGKVLADRMKKMVDKGLYVTLILDCCYSGSILRDTQIAGSKIKSLDYEPELDPPPDRSVPGDNVYDIGDESRSVGADDEWLVNPQGYTVLAACEPHCEAEEIEIVTTGEKRGALTHFLFEAIGDLAMHAMSEKAGSASAATIYQQLCATFQERHPEQVPMLYGRQDLPLLGGAIRSLRASDSLPRVYWMGNSLCLNAGQMHGVRPGDQYVVLPPFETFEEHTSQGPSSLSTTLQISTVRSLTSDFETKKPPCPVKTGWVAKASHRDTPLRLLNAVVPGDIVSSMRASLESMASLRICSEYSAFDKFHVRVKLNERGYYEILDARRNAIPTLPQVPLASIDTETQLANILHHISTLKFIESLKSPLNSRFGSLFTMHATSQPSDTPMAPGLTQHLKKWTLHFHNKSSHTLYMAIFSLDSFWEVGNITRSDRAKGDFLPVQPGSFKARHMTMKIPPFLLKRGIRTCVDVIKVFVTSRPTQFSFMLLGDVASHVDDSDRSSSESEHNLSSLLRQLEGLEHGDRAKDLFPEEGWACRNFVVRTFAPE